MLLPMGDITKAEARARAAEHGFRKVATKRIVLVSVLPNGLSDLLKDWLAQKWSDVGQ